MAESAVRWGRIDARTEIASGARSGAVPAVLVGVLLALAGQYLFWRKTDPVLGLLLFVAAGFFVAWQWPIDEPAPAAPARVRPRIARWMLLLPLALLPAAVGLASILRRDNSLAWGYVGALALLVAAAGLVDWSGGMRLPRVGLRRPGRELWIVGGLLLASFVVRIWEYDTVPWSMMNDDADLIGRGRELLHGRTAPLFASGFFRVPEFHSYVTALFFLWEIEPVFNAQLIGAVPGTLAVGLLYALVRQVYTVPVAIAIAALFSFNRWWVLLSRIGNDFAIQVFLALLAVWCTWRGLKSGRVIWFVLAGIPCGIALIYLYVASIAPVLLLVLWALTRRQAALSTGAGFVGIVIAGVTALGVALPRWYVVATDPSTVQHWMKFVQGPGGGDPGSYPQPYHFFHTVLGLSYRSLGRATLNFSDDGAPLLDPVSGWLTMIGLGFLLYGVARRRAWAGFWVVYFLLAMAIASSTAQKEAYNYRNLMILPAAAVGGGLALVAIARGVASLHPRLERARWGLVVLALGCVGFSTYRDYFEGFKARESIWLTTFRNEIAAGRWLSARVDSLKQRQIVSTLEILNFANFQVAAPAGYARRGLPIISLGDETTLPLPQELPPSVERINLLISPPSWREWKAGWAEVVAPLYYPGPTVETLYAPNGLPELTVYEWTREQIEGRRGLLRDPTATCAGGGSAVGGWRGLVYVPDSGQYRFRVGDGGACVNVGLRRYDATRRETYLSRGWHEIVVGTNGAEQPELTLERQGKSAPVRTNHLYAGQMPRYGFEATFAHAPGEEPFERRYLGGFDVNWESNPPTDRKSFYVELRGIVHVAEEREHELHLVVQGPTTATVGGVEWLRYEGQQQRTLFAKKRLAAGDHLLVIRYHAPNLGGTHAKWFADREPPRRLDTPALSPP